MILESGIMPRYSKPKSRSGSSQGSTLAAVRRSQTGKNRCRASRFSEIARFTGPTWPVKKIIVGPVTFPEIARFMGPTWPVKKIIVALVTFPEMVQHKHQIYSMTQIANQFEFVSVIFCVSYTEYTHNQSHAIEGNIHVHVRVPSSPASHTAQFSTALHDRNLANHW